MTSALLRIWHTERCELLWMKSRSHKELSCQLKILWYVVQDPVPELIDNFDVAMDDFTAAFYVSRKQLRDWVCGKEHMSAFARMLMAEVSGLLKIRYLV